jgi:hypothetical protein
MASAGGGADYVATVRGIIFGPTVAYGMQLKAWGGQINDKLDKLYPKDGKAKPTADDVAAIAQIVANAIEAGDIDPAPVFRVYKGTDDLTTNIQQSTDDKGNVEAGVQISVLNLSAGFTHDQSTTSSNVQNHHLEYEVDVPLRTEDVLQRVTGAVNNWLLNRGFLDVPGTPTKATT